MGAGPARRPGGQGRAGHRDDRRVPHARAPHGRHRPAELPPAPPPRPRRALPRPHPVGPRPGVRRRRVRGRGADEAARRARRAAQLVLPHDRHRVHAHLRARAACLAAGADRGAAPEAAPQRAEVHPLQAQRGRGVRDVPADQVRRAEAVLARGQRDRHPAAGRRAGQGGRARDGRGRHRHAAPRAAQRAGQHRRQADQPDLPRVRGQPRSRPGPRLRRRQVPPRRRRQVLPDVRRRRDGGVAGLQPEPPGGGRPGAGGHRARQAGPARQGPRPRLHRAAADAARRRGVRGPGRRRRDAEPRPAARLPHRRHRARRGQQPGRVHHRPGELPQLHLLHRRREDDRRAGVPRERRRPRGVRLGGEARRGLPRALAQRRRHRHGLLPPPRPQRGRRPLDDPARDVRRRRRQAQRAQALHRVAHRPRRHLHGGRRARPARLLQPAGARLQRGPRAGTHPAAGQPVRGGRAAAAPGPGHLGAAGGRSTASATRTSSCRRGSPSTSA